MALRGLCAHLRKTTPQRNHLITSSIEHPAVVEVMKLLEKEGWEVTWLAPNAYGQVEEKSLFDAVKEQVRSNLGK